MSHTIRVALAAACCASATPAAAQLVIPNAFTPGTPAKAGEVNANFAAVKAAVDAKAPVASPTFTGTVTAPIFSGRLAGTVVAPSNLDASVAPAPGQVPSKSAADAFTWVTPITGVSGHGGITATVTGSTATIGVSFPASPIITAFAPLCSELGTVTGRPGLHTSFGTFTKQYDRTPITITYQGTFGLGAFEGTGVWFQLRVDGGTPTPTGGGAYLARTVAGGSVPGCDRRTRTGFEYARIEAYFPDLPAGTHTVELWAWAEGEGAAASRIFQDFGSFGAQVLVREN